VDPLEILSYLLPLSALTHLAGVFPQDALNNNPRLIATYATHPSLTYILYDGISWIRIERDLSGRYEGYGLEYEDYELESDEAHRMQWWQSW